MALEMNVSEKDKKLLVFLVIFLIVVGCILLIIKPGIERAALLNEEIAISTMDKLDMDNKILTIPALEMQLDAKKKEWKDINTKFYPIMESRDVDKIVTNEVLACGANTRSLQIAVNTHTPSNIVAFQTAGSKDEATNNSELISELYIASIHLVVEGTDANVRKLTDRFVNEYEAARVTSIVYATEKNLSEEDQEIEKTVLNIDLEFYMFEKGE